MNLVTFGVSSTGNIKALLMCLSSVILQTSRPKEILLRLEGEFPAFSDFYLEQLAELARHFGIGFTIHVAESNGVREARDWLVAHCSTPFLWMGDDDVIYEPTCLRELVLALVDIANLNSTGKLGYVVGMKPDVNNRRGYGNFSKEPYTENDIQDECSYNHFYHGPSKVVKMSTADTGNLLIAVENIRGHGIQFAMFPESANASGEDTMFAAACMHCGLLGYLAAGARSYHLEKPGASFSESAARTEMLYRTFDLLGYDKKTLDGFMPYQKRHKQENARLPIKHDNKEKS